MRTSIIIPTLNEEASIRQVISKIDRDLVEEILVIDSGSTDATVEKATQAGAQVINEPRRGYGRACATGLSKARGEIVVFLDADGADDPGHLIHLLEPIQRGDADMVLGSRLAGNMAKGAMPWHQHFGNWLAAQLINLLYGLKLTDLSPFRAVLREKLLGLRMEEMTFGWPTEMITKAARRGWRIIEVPVTYHQRIGGKSKISGTVKGTILATYYIFMTIFKHRKS